jgi:hypothetical protein
MSWIEVLEKTKAAALAKTADPGRLRLEQVRDMPWIEVLQRTKVESLARHADPWRLRLEQLRGKVGDDLVERISTQGIFDVLEVPQRNRGAGACRRLARLMRELGWSPIKARGLNQRGLREQIRGWARDKAKLTVM